MKKTLFARIFAVMMVAVMLLSACLSISATTVSAPGNVSEDENYYTVSFENGVLSVKVNPEKIAGMIQDGKLTKEELANFIPADVLDTLSKGKSLTFDDLTDLVSKYITVDELKSMVDLVPADVLRKYFSVDMLTQIFTVDEIVDLIPVDDIFASVDESDIQLLVNDTVVELVANDKFKQAVLTNAFLKDIVNNTTIVDDIKADQVVLDKLTALVDDAMIAEIMQDPTVLANIHALASSDEIVARILFNTTTLTALENYLTSDANSAVFNAFIADPVVDEALVKISGIRNYLLTDEVMHKLVEADAITKDNIRQIFTDEELSALITDDVIAALLSDTAFADAVFADSDLVNNIFIFTSDDLLTNMYVAGYITATPTTSQLKTVVLTNVDARNMVAASMEASTTVSFRDYWSYVDFEKLATAMGDAKLKEALSNNAAAYGRLFDVVDASTIVDAIGSDACKTLIGENADELINKIGMSKVLEYYDLDDLIEGIGGYAWLLTNGFISIDEAAATVGGYANLIGYFDTDEVISVIGVTNLVKYVDLKDVIAAAGGPKTFVTMYSADELKAIVKAIGADNIKDFFTQSDILKSIDFKQLAKDSIDLIRSKKPEIKDAVKTIGEQALSFLLTEVDGIYLNGTQIFKAGSFDLNKIMVEVLRSIPAVEDFLNLTADDMFAVYSFGFEVDGKMYGFGVEFGFLGDPSALQAKIAKLADNYRLDVSDNGDVALMLVAPDALADIYARVLESDRVPAALKAKLIELPTMTASEAQALLEGLSDAELQSLLDAVEGKLEDIKTKAYNKIDGAFDELVKKYGSVSAAEKYIDSAKSAVDRMIDKFSTLENLKKLRDKAASTIGALPIGSGTTLLDLYNGSGNFTASGSKTIDVLALINKYIKLPDEAILLFNTTELSINASADITVQGLYTAELVLADGSKYTTMLPAGVSLDVLKNLPELGDISSGFCLEDMTKVTEMPAGDLTLYSNDLNTVQFKVGDDIIETVFYVNGATSIKEPAIPASAEKVGYTCDWADYKLNSAKNIVVELEYTAIEYTATFVADGVVVDTVIFTVEDASIAEPAVPNKVGYTGAWEAYTLGASDITINAEYTLIKYTATFMAGTDIVAEIEFDVENMNIVAPAVPSRVGYTGAWEAYTLGASDITINAEYTLIKYTATFMAGTDIVAEIEFDVENMNIVAPAVPSRVGYTGAWEAYTLGASDITINAEYTLITYYATFMAGTTVVDRVAFDVEHMNVTEPTVPSRTGYTGDWEEYTLTAADITINAEYTLITYTATFVAGTTVVDTVEFDVEHMDIIEPAVPSKLGYTGAWEAYTLTASDITINAEYTLITYYATFMADGQQVGEKIPFTVEDDSITEPTVPSKVGYTGVWEVYTLGASDITINAEYTAIVYTATFVADGKVVGTVPFTVEDKSIAEPGVPVKEGYTGKWEEYTLGASDITINAIYTPIGGDGGDGTTGTGTGTTPAPQDEKGGFWWWWILIIIAVIIIAIVLFLIFKKDNDDDNTPPPADPEPVVEPEPEPEIVAPIVEDVAADEVDDLMTDDVALAAVVVADGAASVGPRAIINIGVINDNFNDGDTVDLDALKAKKLVPAKTGRLKVLADGHLNKHELTVEANSFSVQALKMIQLTGGTAVQKK